MTASLWINRPAIIRFCFIATLVVTALFATRHAVIAAELSDQAKSLRMVPADAAYYSSSLRLKEQLDAFERLSTFVDGTALDRIGDGARHVAHRDRAIYGGPNLLLGLSSLGRLCGGLA